MFNIDNNWKIILNKEYEKEYFKKLSSFLEEEYSTYTIFPPKDDIFNAFKYTDFDNVKVVIIGQDPYHEINQAHGLAFSVLEGNKYPPSLKNIFKELNSNYNTNLNFNCNLTGIVDQMLLDILEELNLVQVV
jgi:uracil-DNA glycosylase